MKIKKIIAAAMAWALALGGGAFASVSEVKEEKMNWTLSYPVVTIKERPAVEASINADIQTYIKDLRDRFESGEYYRAAGSYEVHYEDEGLLSLSLKLFGLPYGANGNHNYTISLVYSKETGEPVPLKNYVRPTPDDLEYYRSGHTYLWDGQPMPYEKTFKERISYVPTGYFLPGGGAVCLVYKPYALAAGVFGTLYIRLEPEYVDYLNRKNRA